MSTRYAGSRRRLVLAFDIGTTFSGVSYCILDPGRFPEIKGVMKYPGQGNVSGSAKIPTVIYYDLEGQPRAFGAETTDEAIIKQAEDEEWIKAHWFKLHMPVRSRSYDNVSDELPPLPPNKTIVDLFADFQRYLFQCARTYIQDSHSGGGQEVWDSVESDIKFIIAHPNGWEGPQQTLLRRAAVQADLIPDTKDGQQRILFVTEGEASLHFAIKHGLPEEALESDDGVAIVDAGGGTIDFSVYSQKKGTPLKFALAEIAPSQCRYKGSIFVTIAARVHLRKLLADSDYLDDLDHIVEQFDKTTKLLFRSDKDNPHIQFGKVNDNDPDFGIRFGQLKLEGPKVASFFQSSIDVIIQTIKDQRRTAHKKFTHVVLAGGFCANDWLCSKVTEVLEPLGYTVIRPHHHPDYSVVKAVADGSVSYFINHYVDTRVSGITYGSKGKIQYNPADPEHRRRKSKLRQSASGQKEYEDYFWVILGANKQVPESHVTRRSFRWDIVNLSHLEISKDEIYSHTGDIHNGAFMDFNPGNYAKLCTVEADLSHLANTSSVTRLPLPNGNGYFYRLQYEIALSFGGTEIKAYLVWKEGDEEKTSDAKILYEEELIPAPCRDSGGLRGFKPPKGCLIQ